VSWPIWYLMLARTLAAEAESMRPEAVEGPDQR
jgi:hypothetical protein